MAEKRDYYEVLGVARTADRRWRSPRRTASWPCSTTRTATSATTRPRSSSRRWTRRTRCCTTRTSGTATTATATPAWKGCGAGAVGGPGVDLGDLFGDLFGDFFGGGRRAARQRGRGAARASPRSSTSTWSKPRPGTSKTFTIPTEQNCATCGGTGAKAGTQAGAVPAVRRAGFEVVEHRASVRRSGSQCRGCGGAGVVITDPCPTCRGVGRVAGRASTSRSNMPPGVDTGTALQLPGRRARRRPGRAARRPGTASSACASTRSSSATGTT